MKLKSIPELSERLKYVRLMHDLSQAHLADMVGATQQAIQQAESGKARQPRYLHALSKELKIPFDWLAFNEMPSSKGRKKGQLAENEILGTFYAMPKEDQELMLQLMKNRQTNKKSKK